MAGRYGHVDPLQQRLDRVSQLLDEGRRSGDAALQAQLALGAHAALDHDRRSTP